MTTSQSTFTKPIGILFIAIFFVFSGFFGYAQEHENIPMLDNPMSVQYLKKNLRKSQPRLVLNAKTEKLLKAKLKSDPVVQNMYAAVKISAEQTMKEPLLERVMTGRRLLSVTREMLYRINMLGKV